jgi:hypothetical protein
MRTRIENKVNVENVIQQIENEFIAYSKAVKTVMKLYNLAYKDAKRMLELRLTERLIFKTN